MRVGLYVFVGMAVGIGGVGAALPARAEGTLSEGEEAWVARVQGALVVPGVRESAVAVSWEPLSAGVPVLMGLGAGPNGPEVAARVALTELAAAGLADGLKRLIARPRPYLVDPSLELPAGPEGSFAMPSGHAAVTFAGATVLASIRPDLAPWAWSWATAVSASRVVLGVHYPSDVLAGALLGWGTAALAAWLVPMPSQSGGGSGVRD